VLTFRLATAADAPLLAELNHQLIRDEGHRNPMTVSELEQRMLGFLQDAYNAVLFMGEHSTDPVAYALFRSTSEGVYLRQFFVARGWRRAGIGRAAFAILRTLWPIGARVSVEVLTANDAAQSFWRSLGFSDYSLALEMQN
jgi:GNAT superfamily N-acetyltransferase